ncbi:winged helix-turn-helix transcriptional regulator [Halovivax gelatinilyticus]|uniref:winged helix-turn-helix transcriptional regulator n=1 Tax=Halovivax gelatinilyticus TaxID=2961597 RepID=UPI0020CA7C1C|nr:winged helix-turn-helix transcriptional regulator [Halovivax gelatinilyticus]
MADRSQSEPVSYERGLETVRLLSKKWHPVVVATLLSRGSMGFNQLLDSIPDVSGKVLTETLEALVEADLVERSVTSESPLRVEYELTPSGSDLAPVFEALDAWGRQHLGADDPQVVIADGDRRLTSMYEGWLAERYDVSRAHSALELDAALDAATDVVVVDASLPGADLDALVDSVRTDSRTILLVGDRPPVDLLSVECDEICKKPVVRETVTAAVASQLERAGESDGARERASLSARRKAFESIYPRRRLEDANAYTAVCDRLKATSSTSAE